MLKMTPHIPFLKGSILENFSNLIKDKNLTIKNSLIIFWKSLKVNPMSFLLLITCNHYNCSKRRLRKTKKNAKIKFYRMFYHILSVSISISIWYRVYVLFFAIINTWVCVDTMFWKKEKTSKIFIAILKFHMPLKFLRDNSKYIQHLELRNVYFLNSPTKFLHLN